MKYNLETALLPSSIALFAIMLFTNILYIGYCSNVNAIASTIQNAPYIKDPNLNKKLFSPDLNFQLLWHFWVQMTFWF